MLGGQDRYEDVLEAMIAYMAEHPDFWYPELTLGAEGQGPDNGNNGDDDDGAACDAYLVGLAARASHAAKAARPTWRGAGDACNC